MYNYKWRLMVMLGLGVCGFAELPAADVKLTADDAVGVRSFAAAGNWDSGEPPKSGNDYFTNEHILCDANPSDSSDLEFKGDSLTLDDRFWHIATVKTTVPKLIVKNGGNFYVVDKKGALHGNLTLDGNAELLFKNAGETQSVINNFNFNITGDSTTSVQFSHKNNVFKGLRFAGDLSSFSGKIYSQETNTCLQVVFDEDHASFPGELEGTNGARIDIEVADGVAATLGALDADNVQVTLGEGSTLTVSGAVDLHGNPIRLTSNHTFTADAEKVDFITFTTATMSAGDIAFQQVLAAEATGLQHCPAALCLDTSVANNTYSRSHRKVVYATKSDTAGTNSIFTGPDEDRWSETLDAATAAETDYYLSKSQAQYPLTTSATFYGKSLTLANGYIGDTRYAGSFSTSQKRELTINDFRWQVGPTDATQISFYSALTFNGMITVLPNDAGDSFKLQGWNSRLLTINSTIQGAGNLRLSCNYESKTDPKASYRLNGDNRSFTGRLQLMHFPFTKEAPKANPDAFYVTLQVQEEKNLGGALAAFDAQALSIEDNSLLEVLNSAVFSEPTRGWQVYGHGRISVPENAVVQVLDKQITYADDGTDAGRWTKEGPGTLVLGGKTALVGDLTKQLEVKAGNLRFASTNAIDGVQVSFADATYLDIDLSASGDLAQKGVINLATTPFVSAAASGKIPLNLVATDGVSNSAIAVAICTVSKDLKDSLAFNCPEKYGRRAASVNYGDNGDGTVTFYVQVAARSGMMILFN